jgi:hypothetical protein
MGRSGVFVAGALVLLLLASAASAYVKHRHHAQIKHAQIKHHVSHHLHASHHTARSALYGGAPMGCLPAELRSKVVEIVEACGTHVIRTFTPGALIFGTRYPSEHASCRAADLAGNPSCIYAHLRGFHGGVSTDYVRMAHVHISWHPGGWEQGVRFVHRGGSGTTTSVAFARW